MADNVTISGALIATKQDTALAHHQSIVDSLPVFCTSVGVDVSTSAEVLAANPDRIGGIRVSNFSEVVIMLRFVETPVATQATAVGIALAPGVMNVVLPNDCRSLNGIAASGTARLLITYQVKAT